MTSIGTMIQRLDGLRGTTDLSEWEDRFVERMANITSGGKLTTDLSEKQLETLEELFKKHFAG